LTKTAPLYRGGQNIRQILLDVRVVEKSTKPSRTGETESLPYPDRWVGRKGEVDATPYYTSVVTHRQYMSD